MDIISEVKQKMQRAIDSVMADFQTIRTGKASPALVENIQIMAYPGTPPLKIMELATITIQDAKTLVIVPFDLSIMGEIEKGISSSNVGISPVVDSQLIRINIPPLSEERRLEFVKLIAAKAEHGKVMIRQIRHDAINDTKKASKDDGVSEDEVERVEKEVQKLTDEYIVKIDELKGLKEQELMTI